MIWLLLAIIVIIAVVRARAAVGTPDTEASTEPAAPSSALQRLRLATSAVATFLGAVGSIIGAAIILYVIVLGRTEGDAMFAGAGLVLLMVSLPVLAVGLLLRPPHRGAPPNVPAA